SRTSLEHRSSIFLWGSSMEDHRYLSVPKGEFSMRPPLWHPPIALSTAEQAIIKRIRRAKLFVFLRQHRHTLFAAAFQQELMTFSNDQPQGYPPVPPRPTGLGDSAASLHAGLR